MSVLARVLCIALVALQTISCTQLPSEPKIKAFGQAIEGAADIFKRTVDAHLELAQRLGDDSAALVYITRPESNVLPDYNFPPIDFDTIKNEALLPRRQLIDAIAGYGKALAEASDKGAIDQLEAAAITLATTAGTAFAPLIGGAAIPLISPAARLAGRGIGLAVSNAYATEIYAIMQRIDPVIAKAVAELVYSMQVIERRNEDNLNSWLGVKRAVLNTIREDGKRINSAAYIEFRGAVAEARSIEVKMLALKRYRQVLNALAAAHKSMATPEEPDGEFALVRFISITKDVESMIAAANATK